MSLVTRVKVGIEADYKNVVDFVTSEADVVLNKIFDLANGSGADKANKVYFKTRILGSGASESLDLAGSLADAFGATLTFTKVRVLAIIADAGNTTDVAVGGAASNAWVGMFGDATDKVLVKPGSMFLWIARDAGGGAVVASTGDLLKVADAGAAGVTYTVIVIGE